MQYRNITHALESHHALPNQRKLIFHKAEFLLIHGFLIRSLLLLYPSLIFEILRLLLLNFHLAF